MSNRLGKAAVTMGSLEQFHQEIAAAHKENAASEPLPPTAAESVSLADLMADIRVDFENLSPDELKATYEKLLAVGMDNELTANENVCLQSLVDEISDMMPNRGEYEPERETELDQGEEM